MSAGISGETIPFPLRIRRTAGHQPRKHFSKEPLARPGDGRGTRAARGLVQLLLTSERSVLGFPVFVRRVVLTYPVFAPISLVYPSNLV
jgi:hypothetical protein